MISVKKILVSGEKKKQMACSHGNNVRVQLSPSKGALRSTGGLNLLLASAWSYA